MKKYTTHSRKCQSKKRAGKTVSVFSGIPVNTPQTFGGRLKAARMLVQAGGINQAELAKNCGRDVSNSISNIEAGQFSKIPFDILTGACKFLLKKGISLNWLILGVGPMTAAEGQAGKNVVREQVLEVLSQLAHNKKGA